MQLLEMRLDNVIYRSGFASTRRQVRQIVNHGHITVNGQSCDIASRQVKVNDTVAIKDKMKSSKLFQGLLPALKMHEAPQWLQVNLDTWQSTVLAKPTTKDFEQSVTVSLVVEYYSR